MVDAAPAMEGCPEEKSNVGDGGLSWEPSGPNAFWLCLISCWGYVKRGCDVQVLAMGINALQYNGMSASTDCLDGSEGSYRN